MENWNDSHGHSSPALANHPLNGGAISTAQLDTSLSEQSRRRNSCTKKPALGVDPKPRKASQSTNIPSHANSVEEAANVVEMAEERRDDEKRPSTPSESSEVNSHVDGYSWNDIGSYTKLKDLESRKQLFKTYVKHEAQYAKLLEDRLQYLEQWVKERQDSKDDSEALSEPGDLRREKAKYSWSAEDFSDDIADPSWSMEQLLEYYKPETIPKINRGFRDEMRLFQGSKFAIDVPLEDPEAGNESHAWPEYTRPQDRRSLKLSRSTAGVKRSLPTPGSQKISKVRINSNPVRQGLLRLHSLHLTDPIIISPFKTLLCNEDDIRKHLKYLETMAKSSPEKPNDLSTGGSQTYSSGLGEYINGHKKSGPADEEESNGSTAEASNPYFEHMKEIAKARVTLPHWRCLIELLDKDLNYLLQLRQEIDSGTLREISFDYCWHLFSPGSLIISNELGLGHLQALRVLQVTGGRRLINAQMKEGEWGDFSTPTTYTRDWLNPHTTQSEFSPLILNAYHLDFDGRHYGPVQVDFKIDAYTGAKPVTKLTVYPAQFLGKIPGLSLRNFDGTDSEVLANLKKRGQRFCDLCPVDGEVCHKRYQGMSLDNVPDMVSSMMIPCTSSL